jgi:hypothetical protein
MEFIFFLINFPDVVILFVERRGGAAGIEDS